MLSYTNAGKVTEQGIELGVGYQFTPEIRGDVSFTGFDFDVDEASSRAGDQLVPNTPSKKATFSVSYAGGQGFDGNVTVRLVDGYPWAAGVFQGYVPAGRAPQPERRLPDQQLRPDPRHRDQPARPAALPAVRRVGDRAAGAGWGDGELLTIEALRDRSRA